MNTEDLTSLKFLGEFNLYNKSDSHKFFQFLRENRTLIAILFDNYRDLNQSLKYHNSEEIRKKLWSSDPSFRFKLQKRITRHLSNYLSSLFTVVDYSRALEKHLEQNNDVFNNFNQKKNDFIQNNPHHKFLQDLRNYVSHKSYLKIGSEFSIKIGMNESRKSIYVQKSKILEWNRWSSDSKIFINSQEDRIRLNQILESHFIQFLSFQNWTFLQLLLIDKSRTENHLGDIEIIYEKGREANMDHILSFKRIYIRFINFAYKKALHTTTQTGYWA